MTLTGHQPGSCCEWHLARLELYPVLEVALGSILFSFNCEETVKEGKKDISGYGKKKILGEKSLNESFDMNQVFLE